MPDLGKSTIDPEISVFKCGQDYSIGNITPRTTHTHNLMSHEKEFEQQQQQQQNLIPSKFIHQRGLSSSKSDFDVSKSISMDDY